MNITGLTPTQLRKAADIQERIQELQRQLSQLLGASAEQAASKQPKPPKKARRKMSAAGRAAIAAAARARWAKVKAAGKKSL